MSELVTIGKCFILYKWAQYIHLIKNHLGSFFIFKTLPSEKQLSFESASRVELGLGDSGLDIGSGVGFWLFLEHRSDSGSGSFSTGIGSTAGSDSTSTLPGNTSYDSVKS